jgi:hypothetical protein
MKRVASGLLVALVTAAMLAAVACGRPSKDDKAGQTRTTAASVPAAQASCDMTAELGSCNEYATGTSFGLERSLCEGFKGRFLHTSCPTTGEIGRCVLSGGEVKRYYGASAKDHAYTTAEAKADCESELVDGAYIAGLAGASASAAH